MAAGTVTGQSPAAGRFVPAHATVRLTVAEVPRWRTVASFSGRHAGDSGGLKIRGDRWRLVYRMSYVGTCTFIFWCDGPTADVRMPASGPDVTFGLKDGGARERTFATGPGTYRVLISPGSDTAQWSVEVQDLY
jgi:hypothetical protein